MIAGAVNPKALATQQARAALLGFGLIPSPRDSGAVGYVISNDALGYCYEAESLEHASACLDDLEHEAGKRPTPWASHRYTA